MRVTNRGVAVLCGMLALALVACGDDDGKTTVDGGAGSAGSSAGSGGASGTGDVDAGDVDAGAGAGGAAGAAGVGGAGGTAGDAGAGGTAGAGGSPAACPGGCDDSVDCTVDVCERGACAHVLDATLCDSGESCHPMRGCESGQACGSAGDCADTDGCTVNERCDNASASCRWDALDGDGDGQAPRSCGGGDCNDADDTVFPGAIDDCNGVDDDCDGTVDEAAACENGFSCQSGRCTCPEGRSVCSGQCVDLDTNAQYCGSCRNSCGEAGTCSNGSCTCSAPGAVCGGRCVNLDTNHDNCGRCGVRCDALEICEDGACSPCGGSGEPCCGTSSDTTFGDNDGCPGSDLLCVGTRGDAASECTCPSTHKLCGTTCVDTRSSNQHCGDCNDRCFTGIGPLLTTEICIDSTCEACGTAVGEPCCETGSGLTGPMLGCTAPFLVCNQDTKLCRRGLL